MKKVIALVILIIAVGAGYVGFQNFQKSQDVKKIASFDECAAAGFPILDSYPQQCRISDGRSFTQDVGNELEFTDSIQITSPRPNQKITSPLEITGQAKGTWFFEAHFPVELVDANNKSLAKGSATAKGEWMTETFVPFTTTLEFAKPATGKGKLIIKNANPSDLPENEKELVIPVVF